jgi:hypothetical protein
VLRGETQPRVGRLFSESGPVQPALAELWDAIGDAGPAVLHARAAYQWAWADGEPFVHRYQLDRASALLKRLGGEIPALASLEPDREHEQLPPSVLTVRKVLADLRGDWLTASRPATPEVDQTSPTYDQTSW